MLVLLIGIALAFAFRYYHVSQIKPSSFTPQSPLFQPNPPANALNGQITTLDGAAFRLARFAGDTAPAKIDDTIFQGESLITANKSAAEVTFPSIDFSPISQVNFISTTADSFLLNQTGGTVDYTLSGTKPVSIKVLHLLIELKTGIARVKINSFAITIDILSGSATLGYNSLDNVTQIHQLSESQRTVYNDTTRSVKIR